MAAVCKDTLARAIEIVRAELADAEAALGGYDGSSTWHARHREAMEGVAARLTAKLAARTNDRWDGARVRIHGFASTSTQGMAQALRNWLRAAEAMLKAAS